jgi:hypothetical protein
LKKSAKDRTESAKEANGELATVVDTRSVRELNGLFRGRRKKPVSIEEMDAAIIREAQQGNI